MNKPTYYLWKDEAAAPKEFENTKEQHEQMGFRTVTFIDGKKDRLSDAILAVCRLNQDVRL